MDITNFIHDGVTYPIGDVKSRESIATAFDSTASYSAGDYAMYDGTLYKFTSSHSGDWNSSHAEATCVTDELGSGGGGNAQVMYYYQQPVNTATDAEIFRITNSKINTDTVVLECTFADPSYITSDVTWTSYDGYIAFTGTCMTATTANVTMAYKSEDIVSDRLMTLLWENSSPTSSFAAQTIQLDLSDYDEIMILFAHYTNDMTQSSYIIMKNDNWNPCRVMKSTYATDTYRNVKATNIGITFSGGFNPQTNQNDTSCAIPLKIYGISKNITIKTLSEVEDISSQAVIASSSNISNTNCKLLKSGNVINLNFTCSISNVSDGTTNLVSNLPKPKYEVIFLGLFQDGSNLTINSRFRLTTDGVLQIYWPHRTISPVCELTTYVSYLTVD